MADERVVILESRVNAMEGAVERIADAVQKIAENTTQIAKLEERHSETRNGLERAFDEIAKLQSEDKETDTRLKSIEVVMPGLKESRGFMMRGMVAVVGLVGMAVVALVIVK